MRFEELAYTVDGLPATVVFHARLTVVSLPEDERTAWVARLLGVLEGTRAGDDTSAVYMDRGGRRIGLDRDDQGAATLTDLATGAELPYSAAHLSLDGRFDWFASIGISSRAAGDLVVDADAFTGDEPYDRQDVEAKLTEARKRLARAESQRQAAIARWGRRDELHRRISDLDEAEAVVAAAGAADDWWRTMAAVDEARRAFGPRARLDRDSLTRALARPAEVADDLESLAGACRAMAERRDELVARLDAGTPAEVDDAAGTTLRELTEDVEPAYIDALAALADACRPFGVTLDAARIQAAGVGAADIETVGTEVLAEIAVRVTEARDARLQQALEEAESEGRAARERLELGLAGLGLPTGGTGDLAAGAEVVAARAQDVPPESTAHDPGRSAAERTRLVKELQRAERNLPDVAQLTERASALERQVARLEASLTAGHALVTAEGAEGILLQLAAKAGRIGRRRESLPLVVNDALASFATSDKSTLLDVVARLAETNQVIYLTDDPDTLAWASGRAALGEITLWRPDGLATVA